MKILTVTESLPKISDEPAQLRWSPSFDNLGSGASILGLFAALAAHRRSVLNGLEIDRLERAR